MSYAEIVRPKLNAQDKYACPDGHKVCNENFLKSQATVEYAVCIPEYLSTADDCPITAIAWTLDGMTKAEASKYEKAHVVKNSIGSSFTLPEENL